MEVDSLKNAVQTGNLSSGSNYTEGVSTEKIKKASQASYQDKDIRDSDEKSEGAESFNTVYFDKVIEAANKKIFGTDRQLSYSYHKATHSVLIRVIDSNTKEVLKEIPPEKTLDAVAKMWELAGIIIDKKI